MLLLLLYIEILLRTWRALPRLDSKRYDRPGWLCVSLRVRWWSQATDPSAGRAFLPLPLGRPRGRFAGGCPSLEGSVLGRTAVVSAAPPSRRSVKYLCVWVSDRSRRDEFSDFGNDKRRISSANEAPPLGAPLNPTLVHFIQ